MTSHMPEHDRGADMLADYQRGAFATAIYPRVVPDFGLAYAALGLCNEVGEYAESDGTADEAIGELGDVAWYWAVTLAEVGKTPHDLTKEFFPDVRPLSDIAAAIAGKVKKCYRDSWSHADTAERVLPLLTEFYLALEAEADLLGVEMVDLLGRNLAKLASRQERGVLTGEGGDR